MDFKTNRFFESLNAECKQRFGKKMVKSEEDQLVSILRNIVKSSSISDKQRAKIKYGLDNGLFGSEKHEMIDDSVTKEIQKFMDTKIESAIRNGLIPPPDLNEYERISNKFKGNA